MTPDTKEAWEIYTKAFNEIVYGSNEPSVVAAEVGRRFDVRYGLWLPRQPRKT